MSWEKSFISKDTQRELHKLWLMRCVWNVDSYQANGISFLLPEMIEPSSPFQSTEADLLFLGSLFSFFLGGKNMKQKCFDSLKIHALCGTAMCHVLPLEPVMAGISLKTKFSFFLFYPSHWQAPGSFLHHGDELRQQLWCLLSPWIWQNFLKIGNCAVQYLCSLLWSFYWKIHTFGLILCLKTITPVSSSGAGLSMKSMESDLNR